MIKLKNSQYSRWFRITALFLLPLFLTACIGQQTSTINPSRICFRVAYEDPLTGSGAEIPLAENGPASFLNDRETHTAYWIDSYDGFAQFFGTFSESTGGKRSVLEEAFPEEYFREHSLLVIWGISLSMEVMVCDATCNDGTVSVSLKRFLCRGWYSEIIEMIPPAQIILIGLEKPAQAVDRIELNVSEKSAMVLFLSGRMRSDSLRQWRTQKQLFPGGRPAFLR